MEIIVALPRKDPLYKTDSISSESAAITASMAISIYKPDIFVSLGVAGGVKHCKNNDLKINDVCIAK